MEEVWKGRDVRSTTASSNAMGTRGLWSMPLHSSQACRPSGPNLSKRACPLMEATAPMRCRPRRCISSFRRRETGSRLMEWGARNAFNVGGRPDGSVRAAYLCRHVGGELAVGQTHPRFQVRGYGVQQSPGQPGLAAVHPLQPAEAHVGGPQLRRLHSVADSMQGSEYLVKHLPVVGLVGLQNPSAAMEGQGLFQGHSLSHALNRRAGSLPLWAGHQSGRL